MLRQAINSSSSKGTAQSFSSVGWIIATVFALAFSIPGIALTIASGVMNTKAFLKRNWIEIQVTPESRKPLKKMTEEDIYYTYTYEGGTYQGDGFNYAVGSDTTDRLFSEIKKAIRNKKTVSCWVNPVNPEDSQLIPVVPSGIQLFFAIFGLSHGVTGLAIGAYYLSSRRQKKSVEAQIASHPDEPLLWRKDWAQGISTHERFSTRWLWVYACIVFFVCIIWTTINFWLYTHPFRLPATGISLLTLIPLIGTFRSFRNHKLNKNLSLQFDPPLVMGTKGQVRLVSERNALPYGIAEKVKWSLTNTEKSSDGEDSSEVNHCEVEANVTEQSSSALNLEIDIPTDGIPTTAYSDETEGSRWKLKGSGKGIKLGPFELPVAKSNHLPKPEEVALQEIADIDISDLDSFQHRLASDGITMRAEGNEIIFDFAPNRNKASSVTSLIIGIGFIIVPITVTFLLPMALIFGTIFGLIGIGMLIGAYYQIFRKTEIRSSPTQLQVIKTTRGKSKTLTFQEEEIETILAEETVRVNNQPYYAIKVKNTNGRTITASPNFKNKRDCQMMARFLLGDGGSL